MAGEDNSRRLLTSYRVNRPTSSLPLFQTLRVALSDVLAVFWKLVPLSLLPAIPAAFFIARLECDGKCEAMNWFDQSQILSAFDMVLVAPASVAALRLLLRRDTTLRGAIGFALRRWFSIGEIRLLVGMMTSIGLFLLVVPAVLIVVLTSLAIPALALDGLDSNRALRSSRDLVQSEFWRIAALLVLSSIPELAVEAFFYLVSFFVDGFWADFVSLTLELTLSGLAGTFFLATMGEAYVRLGETASKTRTSTSAAIP
jgi:hypothetical protein